MDPKDEIKSKLDIVELIGEYLELKPAGMNGFRALCPFHGEKSPSFHVSSDRQIFHCFGCGEGGDVFTFVQKMEGMDFPEVLIHLGKKTGVEVKRFSTTEGNIKQRLMVIHELATSFYKKVLSDSSIAQSAREYLSNRGIDQSIIEKFELGFATDDWSRLSDVLLKKGFSESELVQSGLSLHKRSGSGVIDRFRNRIMIPLRDQHGNTVGFTGRVLPGADKESAKYMNSPETAIYHKGRLLYGLDLAKRAIKDQKSVIVVEGNLDVVASHKANVENVVASSGTALTYDQLELLKRYTQTVIFCFDRDVAGLNAAKKGVTIARALGYDVRALLLPNDVKDPDDLVQKNPDEWKSLAKSSVPFMQFLLEQVTTGRDVTNVDDKRLIAKELLPALKEIRDVVEQEHWLQKIALILGTDLSVLRKSIAIVLETKQTQVKSTEKILRKFSKTEQVFMVLLGMAVNDALYRDRIFTELSVVDIGTGDLSELYSFVKDAYTHPVNRVDTSFFEQVRSSLAANANREAFVALLDQSSLFAEKTLQDLDPEAISTQLTSLFHVLKDVNRHGLRMALAQKLRLAETSGDNETVTLLLSQLKDLN